MAERIYPLNVDIAAELRAEVEDLDTNVQWRLARLCEKAQQIGYHDGYVRGMVDGRHYQRAENRAAALAKEVSDAEQ
jgi:hypothetical protein